MNEILKEISMLTVSEANLLFEILQDKYLYKLNQIEFEIDKPTSIKFWSILDKLGFTKIEYYVDEEIMTIQF